VSAVLDHALVAAEATLGQLAHVLGPAAACAVALHQLERLVSGLLVRTFGWRALLLTGWLGTPIHELSHMAACALFAHEVEEVKLFAPDPESGTLGFVRHRWSRRNPWAEVGRFFIGIAPLLGGSLALWACAQLLLPDAALRRMTAVAAGSGAPAEAAHAAWAAFVALLQPAHLSEPRFWAFLVLAACIGTHLAPSRSDLRGAAWGFAAVVAVLWAVNLAAGFFGGLDASLAERALAATAPVVGLLVLAVLLVAALFALALVVTALVERARGQPELVGRFLAAQWLRLVLLAAATAAFAVAARLI
jgi:hypothetical protein